MTRKVEVIIWNKEGCPNELLGSFLEFPYAVTVKKGERVKVEIPVTSYLAEYRQLVIRKNSDGDNIPTPEDRRSDEEIKEMRQDESKSEEGHNNYPHSINTRRGILD